MTLLVKSKNNVATAHEKTKGVSYQNSDDDVFEALLQVAFPDFKVENYGSFHTLTNQYKKCGKESAKSVPLANDDYVMKIKEEPRNVDFTLRMSSFLKLYIKNAEMQWLINAIIELIEEDKDVTEKDEWCVAVGTIKRKYELRGLNEIYIDWFMADVWRYVITKSRKNIDGKISYEQWFERDKVTGKFKSNIGDNRPQDYCILWEKETDSISQSEGLAQNDQSELMELEDCVQEQSMDNQKTSNEVISESILKSGQVLADSWNKIIKALSDEITEKHQVSKPAKKLKVFYESDITEGELRTLLYNGDIEPIMIDKEFTFDDISGNEIFEFDDICSFSSSFDDDYIRCVEVGIEMQGFEIIGKTSGNKWKSKSYMNNVLFAGKCRCNGLFQIVAKNENMIIVQFLYLGRW